MRRIGQIVLYAIGGALIVVGAALFLVPALHPGLSIYTVNDLDTEGAASLFVGLVLVAAAAGGFRAWARSTVAAPVMRYVGPTDPGLRRCPVCDTPNVPDAARCVACGAPLAPPGL